MKRRRAAEATVAAGRPVGLMRPRRGGLPAAPPSGLLLSGLLLAVLLLASAGAVAAGYLRHVEDLPLMPGLVELPDAGVAFDKPGGRIVEAWASGEARRADVLAFYAETLPQLGWRRRDDGGWRREGEVLRLTVTPEGARLTVRYSLAPE